MSKLFDKIKAAGLAGVAVTAGAWVVTSATDWLQFKGVPEDVVLSIGVFLGGLVTVVVGYLKTEHTGQPTPPPA